MNWLYCIALMAAAVNGSGGGGGGEGGGGGGDASSSLFTRYQIGYISDVEGNWEYMQRCVLRSTVLYYADPTAASSPTLPLLGTDLKAGGGGDSKTSGGGGGGRYESLEQTALVGDGSGVWDRRYELRLRDGCHFVFGGDACDLVCRRSISVVSSPRVNR